MATGGRAGVTLALVALCCALAAAPAGAARAMPNHHQMEALFVIDHRGASPRSDTDLRPYSRPFQKIMARCTIGVDALTNMAISLADKASVLGGRRVTSLRMLQSIARRITWVTPRQPCFHIYDLAEGHAEAGDF